MHTAVYEEKKTAMYFLPPSLQVCLLKINVSWPITYPHTQPRAITILCTARSPTRCSVHASRTHLSTHPYGRARRTCSCLPRALHTVPSHTGPAQPGCSPPVYADPTASRACNRITPHFLFVLAPHPIARLSVGPHKLHSIHSITFAGSAPSRG